MLLYELNAPGVLIPREKQIPLPQDTEVQIRVNYVGICGSDIHLYRGSYNGPHKYPMLFGHEWSGVITEIGSKVTDFKVGDFVTGDCSKFCGECDVCKVDKNLCTKIEKFGITIDGASAEYIVRDQRYLYKAFDDIQLSLLCLAEPIAVAAHLITQIKRVVQGKIAYKRVLVVGGGVIGASVAMLLKYLENCQDVSLYDIASYRTAILQNNGIQIVDALPEPSSDNQGYAAMYASAQYDIVIETTGVPTVFANALHYVKASGILGCAGMIANVEIAQKLIVTKRLTIVGSIGGTGDFSTAMKFIQLYPAYVRALMSHCIPISQAQEAFRCASNANESMKVVLKL